MERLSRTKRFLLIKTPKKNHRTFNDNKEKCGEKIICF
ncbi:hypothetical protein NT05HA_0129 [Aggregatibacter aphrophilus NJ8700]|nr:hypothetical protein NT05HA_0129 [Aggregatibacter aphrophilus NJ8700]